MSLLRKGLTAASCAAPDCIIKARAAEFAEKSQPLCAACPQMGRGPFRQRTTRPFLIFEF
jgi:hypothetical protein